MLCSSKTHARSQYANITKYCKKWILTLYYMCNFQPGAPYALDMGLERPSSFNPRVTLVSPVDLLLLSSVSDTNKNSFIFLLPRGLLKSKCCISFPSYLLVFRCVYVLKEKQQMNILYNLICSIQCDHYFSN